MNKAVKWFLFSLLILAVLAFTGFQIMKFKTKQHSPEQTIAFNENGYNIEVTYSRPFKKGRALFGSLVPYNEVWRTGANEPTAFNTSTDLYIQGQKLPAGDYTLWTIPGPREWQIIFNSGHPGWGVGWDSKASRDPKLDVVTATTMVQRNFMVLEQFTINIEGNPAVLQLGWDFIRADVPLLMDKNQ